MIGAVNRGPTLLPFPYPSPLLVLVPLVPLVLQPYFPFPACRNQIRQVEAKTSVAIGILVIGTRLLLRVAPVFERPTPMASPSEECLYSACALPCTACPRWMAPELERLATPTMRRWSPPVSSHFGSVGAAPSAAASRTPATAQAHARSAVAACRLARDAATQASVRCAHASKWSHTHAPPPPRWMVAA